MPRNAIRLTLAVTIAAAPLQAREKENRPDPYVAVGKPVACINIRSIRSTHVRDDRSIDFITNGDRVFRNVLPYSCPRLGFERRFSYSTSLSQICSVDVITVLFNVGASLQPGASCGLGKFQPMKRTPK